MIIHTVAFTLEHASGSAGEVAFLADARILDEIAEVQDFRQLRQVSPKSDFRFSFSMRFDDQDAYDRYNEHPIHQAFVRDRWQTEVGSFQELDFVPL